MSVSMREPGPRRVTVVGGGLAGLRTVAELRSQGFDGELTWLGAEPVPAYDRPPLSKELLTRSEPLWLAQDLEIDVDALADRVLLGRMATGLGVGSEMTVQTDGESLRADAVVVATGAAPIRPWPDAMVLHGLDDAARLRGELRTGRHLVVVGAGWIGAEVAGVAAAAGCRVTVLEAGSAPLGRQLGERAGERTRRWYAAAGVELRTDVVVVSVAGGTVTLDSGDLVHGDAVLVAIGVRPQTGWLAGAVPMLASGHVPTTRGGQTRTSGLWAVGDSAARETVHAGVVPGGHWFSALRDPALVAADLLGRELPATEPAPEMFSDQLGHHLEVIGRRVHDEEPGGRRVLREHAAGGWTELHLSGSTLVGAAVVDHPREVSAVRKLLRGDTLPVLDLDAAADPGTPLPRAVR